MCLLGIEGYEGIDIVERIEQKMGAYLKPEILQFVASALFFHFLSLDFQLVAVYGHLGDGAHHDRQQERNDVAEDEPRKHVGHRMFTGNFGRHPAQLLLAEVCQLVQMLQQRQEQHDE